MKEPLVPKPRQAACSRSAVQRNVWCTNYDSCLDQAIKYEWPTFTCSYCSAFQSVRISPAWLQKDADRCRALIYSLFKTGVRRKHLYWLMDHFETERGDDHLWYVECDSVAL